MRAGLDPFSVLVVSIAGWINQHQHHVIEYLIEENRVLREQIGRRRKRFNETQRRRLAAKAKKVGRQFWHLATSAPGRRFQRSKCIVNIAGPLPMPSGRSSATPGRAETFCTCPRV
jgi:hypothetical protein